MLVRVHILNFKTSVSCELTHACVNLSV